MKKIKRILISSMIESLGISFLDAAWYWHKGEVCAWWYHPILILLLFIGLTLCKIGFKIYTKE